MSNSHGRFVWYELATSDIKAAKSFYADVVGWGTKDASTSGITYSLFTAGKALGGLLELPEAASKTGARPSWTGYIGVNDVDATVDRIKRLGGVVYVPPKDNPNISRFSVVADPQMATLALFEWLKPSQEQPADLDAPGCVGWHELLAADWEKAWAFYGELFGWQKALAHTDVMGTYQMFSVGGIMIGGMFTKPPQVPVPFWLYYVSVDDIDAAAKRVSARNGKVIYGPIEVPGGSWVVQCTDPQGAIFGLVGKRRRKRRVIASSMRTGWQANPQPPVTRRSRIRSAVACTPRGRSPHACNADGIYPTLR
jgi:uncharacterized protein